MTNLGLTFSDLYKEVSNFLGLGLSPAGDNLELAKKYARDGYRLFLMGIDPRSGRAYQWSFLAPAASLDLWPGVGADAGATVTGVCASGVTTLTAALAAPPAASPPVGPFYPSMVGRTIQVTDVGSFTISDCVSAGVIQVQGDAACTANAITFAVVADGTYGLPDGFAAIIDDPALAPAPNSAVGFAGAGRIAPRSAAYLRQIYAGGSTAPVTGAPRYYAIVPRAFSPADGQRYDMLVWPTPGTHCQVAYRYRLEPGAMSADGDLPLGGPQHALTVLQAALAVAEQRHNDQRGIHTEQFERLMAFSIDLDAANKPHNLGDSGGGTEAVWRTRNSVTYP
jgi:hypothetical protein